MFYHGQVKKNKKFVLLLITLLGCLLSPAMFLLKASRYEDKLGTPILEKGDLETIIYNIIQYILGFLGVIAVLVIAYGGYTWMTAAGNEEKTKKAKGIIRNGIIGLIIILLSYGISLFVIYLIRGELPK